MLTANIVGDATLLQDRPAIIAHIVNDQGGWGKGFVVTLAKRYPSARTAYRNWARGVFRTPPWKLGQVDFVIVGPGLYVANMLAQKGLGHRSKRSVQYGALRKCLRRVRNFAASHQASVQMPRIGCGLGGGDWEIVKDIVETEMKGVRVTVYGKPK